jgi:hypothetical protein
MDNCLHYIVEFFLFMILNFKFFMNAKFYE